MERIQERAGASQEIAAHSQANGAKEILITPAAILYAVSLILGGLGILSFFVFPHAPAVVALCLSGVLLAAGGGFFAIRSVIRGLHA